MAAIETIYSELTTQASHTGDTNFVDVDTTNARLASGSFTVGKQYLLVVFVRHAGNSSSANSSLRVQHGSTTFDDSDHTYEYSGDSARPWSYTWFTVWTAVSGEDIDLQFKVLKLKVQVIHPKQEVKMKYLNNNYKPEI